MAKITKTEFLENIHNIINEGMNLNENQEIDNSKKFNIRHYITSLLEDGQRNPKLMTYLNNYNTFFNTNKDAKEFMVFEQFGLGLSQFAVNNKDVKRVINQMNETLDAYGHELEAYMLIEQVQDSASKDMIRSAYDNYVINEDAEARDILVDAIDMVAQEGDPIAPKLNLVITADSVNRLPKIDYGMPESKYNMIQLKIQDDKNRRRMEEIQAQVDDYARKVFEEAEAENQAKRNAMTFESIVNNNGINLKQSIKNISASNARSNKKLMETLEQYAGALNQGLYEERLYEGFILNISKFNYLNPVEKEIKRINESVSKHPGSVAVTKILEEMSTTNSYYIIPLIEEDAVRYVLNPTDTNRMQLRNALCSFAGDPYCNAMLETIETVDFRSNGKTLEDRTMSIKDQAKIIKENANISTIYSPVQYIKENECVFNANGQFYVKKGNTLATLSEEYVPQLSESFITLCQLVNDPRVIINEDSIVLVGGDKVATINESYVDINGNRETTDTLRNLNEMAMKYEYFDNNFFIMASCLHENFDNIAKIGFGKHIALNEDNNINVDIFHIGNNIFINTVNENIDKSTFYHNVNPIQCRNIINKHMGINIASLFEELMPSQDKIMLKLNETKNEYEAAIKKYEDMIAKLKKAKEESVSEDNETKLSDAIDSASKKLDGIKAEYKDWQNEVDKTTQPSDDNTDNDSDNDENSDSDTEQERQNEPIDADEVDAAKPELTQPLSAEDGGNTNDIEDVSDNDDEIISDDTFKDYLNNGSPLEGRSEVPDNADEMDPTEVNMSHHALAGDGSENDEPDVTSMEAPMSDENPNGEESTEDDEYSDEEIPEEPEPDTFTEVDTTEETPENDETEENPEDIEPEETDIDEPTDFDTEGETDDYAEEPDTEEVAVPDGYKIADITFDQNIKTGELFRTGNVTIVCPMVGENGEMYVDTQVYNFYIDESTHLPIVDAADIPVALYNAIVTSIQTSDDFNQADSNGTMPEDLKYDHDHIGDYMSSKEVKDATDELEKNDDDQFFDFSDDDDSLTITSKDADQEDNNLDNLSSTEKPVASSDDEENLVSISDIFGDLNKDNDKSNQSSTVDNDDNLDDIFANDDNNSQSNSDDDLDDIFANDDTQSSTQDFPSYEDADKDETSDDIPEEDFNDTPEDDMNNDDDEDIVKKDPVKESRQFKNRKNLINLSAVLKGGRRI